MPRPFDPARPPSPAIDALPSGSTFPSGSRRGRVLSLGSVLVLVLATALSTGCIQRTHYPDGSLKTIGKVNIEGNQFGEWQYFYPDSTVMAEGAYRNDLQWGKWVYYYPNGQREIEGEFADDARTGSWTYWYPDGKVRARGAMRKSLESGDWEFFGSAGDLICSGPFSRGLRHLRWNEKNGTGYYFDGSPVGPWESPAGERAFLPLPEETELVIERWQSGEIRREGFTDDGRKIGRWLSRHRDGAPRIAVDFLNGAPTGNCWAWNAAGELIAVGEVVRGTLSGTWKIRKGEELIDWEVSTIRPPQPLAMEWSAATLADAAHPETVVETWLSEIRLDHEEKDIVRGSGGSGSFPTQRVELPYRGQPWTQHDEEMIKVTPKIYGMTPPRGGRAVFDKYSPKGARRKVAEGDRTKSAQIEGRALPWTKFPKAEGGVQDLRDLQGKKWLVLVILRGFGGQVCVYCATQTKAYAEQNAFEAFQSLGAEVCVLYPGKGAGLKAFRDRYVQTFGEDFPPYQFLYDPGLRLVYGLGISDKLALPTTLIVDPEGVVRFSYVGQSIADRPSAKLLIGKLGELSGAGAP